MSKSNECWQGYDDARAGRFRADGFLHNSIEKDNYLTGYDDSVIDKENNFDARG